ncbi:MAG: ComF family protein [Holophagales bacterium]|nr:ComF family protein [Holophagales bacterium]MYH24483.1 ComF family protein [Holophagales bacterium]
MTADGPPTRRRLPTCFYGSGAQNVCRLARRFLTFALWLLLPRPCLTCSAPAERELGLCKPCRRLLESPPRGAAREDRLEGSDGFFWLWVYRPPLDQVILGLKYRRLDYLGRHIADEASTRLGIELRRADVLVPMPMHWRRRLARGHNHAESIARPLARRLGRPLSTALRRRTLGRPQVGRGRRQRLVNPGIAFTCGRPAAIRDRVVLLVDDVVTTGATAGKAAHALKAAGAGKVIVFAAARTQT